MNEANSEQENLKKDKYENGIAEKWQFWNGNMLKKDKSEKELGKRDNSEKDDSGKE